MKEPPTLYADNRDPTDTYFRLPTMPPKSNKDGKKVAAPGAQSSREQSGLTDETRDLTIQDTPMPDAPSNDEKKRAFETFGRILESYDGIVKRVQEQGTSIKEINGSLDFRYQELRKRCKLRKRIKI